MGWRQAKAVGNAPQRQRAEATGKTALQNTRIEAAIVDQGGQLVALGESCDPRADWIHMQARIRHSASRERKRPAGKHRRLPASVSQPEHPQRKKTAGKPSRRPIGRNAQYRVHFPAFSGAEGSATLSAQQGDANGWKRYNGKKERKNGRRRSLRRCCNRHSPCRELPAESDAQTALDVEEISRLIHQNCRARMRRLRSRS